MFFMRLVAGGGAGATTSANTGLPALVAALPPPNPCPVTAFAKKKKRKCRAQAADSATRGRYAQEQKTAPNYQLTLVEFACAEYGRFQSYSTG